MTRNFGITDRVHFPGSVGNISEWYERADLFVLSSIVEGFPNVLLEASYMAYLALVSIVILAQET